MFRSTFPILRTMYMRFTVFSDLSIFLFCFTHFGFYEISTPVMRTMLTMVKVVQFIISDIAQTGYIRFPGFWNFSQLLFVLAHLAFTKFLLRWCALCKHSLNHHFRHSAHSVYKIYSVFKLVEFAVCFAHFGFYEISTPVMRTMLTMPNIIFINISNTP